MSLELVRCPDCGGVVPADSIHCPRCGGSFDSRGRKILRRIFWVLAVLTVVAIVLSLLPWR